MLQILVDNPLLVLCIVAAIGYPLGQVKIGGSSLGVAAVLFVGLFMGALDPRLKLPEICYLLGLVMFVYTIGLSSGPEFFAALRRKGVRDNLLVVGMLIFGALLLVLLQRLLQLHPAVVAGLFAGSFTNTPALASVLDYIRTYAPAATRDALLADPVVGYSAAYPVGVIGTMLTIVLVQRLWKTDYAREAKDLHTLGFTHEPLLNRTVRVTKSAVAAQPLAQLTRVNSWDVVFGRFKHHEALALANGQTCFALGDLVSIVGTAENLDQVTQQVGELSEQHLDFDRSTLDYRRIFVSNPAIAGQRLSNLRLMQQFGAVVTRIRRGDNDLLPHADTMLELGDRVRVIADRGRMDAVSGFLGDSYRALSEVNILTLSLGLMLGVLVGLIPIPLPGGMVLKLGYAGGPLLVGLMLGARERTGSFVWSLPYSANLTLRQLGLILFLASVGTRAGSAFLDTFTQGNGLTLVLAGAVATCVTVLATLWVGQRVLHIPMSLLIGLVAGLQTQPAVLGFATEQTHNDLPNVGYATVYPVAIVAKIIIAQLVLAWLW